MTGWPRINLNPVQRLSDGRIEITSQNHNYAVPAADLRPDRARITHLSLNDESVEGLEVVGRPAYSVQFHPEAAPGPRDSLYHFHRFIREMQARRAAVPTPDQEQCRAATG